jgi:hypothetical protein
LGVSRRRGGVRSRCAAARRRGRPVTPPRAHPLLAPPGVGARVGALRCANERRARAHVRRTTYRGVETLIDPSAFGSKILGAGCAHAQRRCTSAAAPRAAAPRVAARAACGGWRRRRWRGAARGGGAAVGWPQR